MPCGAHSSAGIDALGGGLGQNTVAHFSAEHFALTATTASEGWSEANFVTAMWRDLARRQPLLSGFPYTSTAIEYGGRGIYSPISDAAAGEKQTRGARPAVLSQRFAAHSGGWKFLFLDEEAGSSRSFQVGAVQTAATYSGQRRSPLPECTAPRKSVARLSRPAIRRRSRSGRRGEGWSAQHHTVGASAITAKATSSTSSKPATCPTATYGRRPPCARVVRTFRSSPAEIAAPSRLPQSLPPVPGPQASMRGLSKTP